MSWIVCIADAQSAQGYAELLSGAGFKVYCVEAHDEALTEMVHQIRRGSFSWKLQPVSRRLNYFRMLILLP
jgi:hypothetical protein